MVQENVEVLVVDDIISAAEDFARLIKAHTGLHVAHTDDPATALDVVQRNRLGVVVLDQRLEGKSPERGTELYRQIRQLDPHVRAIMLTGEAGDEEVGAALSLAYGDYLKKNSISELGSRVVHQYALHQAAVATLALASEQPVVLKRRSFFSGKQADFRLISADLLSEDYVADADWHTVLTLQVGQQEKAQLAWQIERTVSFEHETTGKLTAELGLSAKEIAALTGKLSSELTQRFKQVSGTKIGFSGAVERTFALPAEPANPNELHVRLRRIQQAPVHKRVRANLRASCTCCGLTNLVTLEVLIPTERIMLRQEDRMSDDSRRVYNLGSE